VECAELDRTIEVHAEERRAGSMVLRRLSGLRDDKLHDLVGAIHLRLTDKEVQSLEEFYKPQAVSGH
jgi:hypothetical protein